MNRSFCRSFLPSSLNSNFLTFHLPLGYCVPHDPCRNGNRCLQNFNRQEAIGNLECPIMVNSSAPLKILIHFVLLCIPKHIVPNIILSVRLLLFVLLSLSLQPVRSPSYK